VRVVWKHFPLDFHPNAPLAHLASMAASEQGKFWEMHDKIFAAQDKMNQAQYDAYAKELGMDVKRFDAAIREARGKTTIDTDAAEGKSLGVTGTPAFFVNGKFLSGAKPYDEFAAAINAELTRLNLTIPPAAQQAGAGGAPPGGAPAAGAPGAAQPQAKGTASKGAPGP
jgi:protein-disulfide isomerase